MRTGSSVRRACISRLQSVHSQLLLHSAILHRYDCRMRSILLHNSNGPLPSVVPGGRRMAGGDGEGGKEKAQPASLVASAPACTLSDSDSGQPQQGWTDAHRQVFSRCSSGKTRSSAASIARRARREKAAEAAAAPRPWPDDRKYNHRSLFLFTLHNPFRQTLIKWIEWKYWDTKVICVILLNTLTLAMYDCFDKPSMRACAPHQENMPAGPYGYCLKMGTGIGLGSRVSSLGFRV